MSETLTPDASPSLRGAHSILPSTARRSSHLDLSPLQPLLARIEARYRPLQVWLFGSRARGDAGTHSDWDLLIVVPDEASDADLDLMAAWEVQSGLHPVHADLIPIRATEFREDLGTVNSLPYIVGREGVMLVGRIPDSNRIERARPARMLDRFLLG